jgi:hypothetical protein
MDRLFLAQSRKGAKLQLLSLHLRGFARDVSSGSGCLPCNIGTLAAISCLLLSSGVLAFADDNSPRPNFTLTLADGSVSSGLLEQIGDNWSVRLSGAKPVHATGLQAVSLRRENSGLPDFPRAEQVVLVNGDRLPGTVRVLNGDRLRIRAHLGIEAELTIPLSAVALISKAVPDGVDNADKWRRRLISDKRSRDTAYLGNGDVIEGILNSITPAAESLQMESSKKDITLPFSKVALIAFNTELAGPIQPSGVHGRLVLGNGCRLTLSSARSDDHVLKGRTAFGADVSIPLDHVQAIDWLGGCAVYLSDLKPRTYHFHPFLADVSWSFVTDASVMETDLRLGGQLFDKGLGVHTASRLTYALASDDHWFEALVGLDDLVGTEGRTRIQVLLDGKPQKLRWDGELTWKKGPQAIRLPVSGAKELTLVSDFGSFGDVQGCVDWVNARLIKNQK